MGAALYTPNAWSGSSREGLSSRVRFLLRRDGPVAAAITGATLAGILINELFALNCSRPATTTSCYLPSVVFFWGGGERGTRYTRFTFVRVYLHTRDVNGCKCSLFRFV